MWPCFVVVSPMDFTAVSLPLLRIEQCDRKKCVDIRVVDDVTDMPENETESFYVSLMRTENVPITVSIDPDEAEVQIFDRSKCMF